MKCVLCNAKNTEASNASMTNSICSCVMVLKLYLSRACMLVSVHDCYFGQTIRRIVQNYWSGKNIGSVIILKG